MISSDQLITYIQHNVIGRPDINIDLDTPLVSSGLIDSFAIADILMGVENLLNIPIPPGSIQVNDVETVSRLIQAVQQLNLTTP